MWNRRFLVLAAVLVLLLGGLYLYLGSSGVAQQIRDRLRKMLGDGVEVEVASARIGLVGSSTARGIAVHDRDRPAGEVPPVLQIPSALLDLSLFGVLGASPPAAVDLHQPVLHLRFAETGKLLTALPRLEPGSGAVPPVRIHQGRLVLDQQGRKPFVLAGLEAEIRAGPANAPGQANAPGHDGYAITGTLADPEWGEWDFKADYRPADRLFVLRLEIPRTDLDMDRLRSLPFVSPRVWAAVEVAGTTSVELTLWIPIGTPGVRYRIALDVERADVYVPSIELRAAEVAGRVLIENAVVQLQNVAGQFAGGRLETTGRLDFSRPPSQLQFNIKGKDVRLTRLPRSWKLPEQLSGQVDISADLQIRLEPTGVRTLGKSSGKIANAVFAEIPLPGRVPIDLVAGGSGFRLVLPWFLSRPPASIVGPE